MSRKKQGVEHEPSTALPPAGQACANCGKPTTRSGRQGGLRFCMARECQNAKQRHYYSRDRGVEGQTESRPCSNCGIELQVRQWRITDLDYGRWCRRADCQRAKAVATHEYRAAENLWNRLEATTCLKCGRYNAKKGYAHANPEWTGWCYTTGELLPDGMFAAVAKAAWMPQTDDFRAKLAEAESGLDD